MQCKILISILVILTLSACAPRQVQPEYRKVLPGVRQTQLSTINSWELDGAFSLQQPGQSVVANYRWIQRGSQYNLRISSPLNLFSVKILGEPNRVRLWRSSTAVASAQDPEALMQQQLGWQLPISNLQYWVRSLPAPGPYQANYDHYGHLVELHQEGWTIRYFNYVSIGANDLPSLLKLNDDTWNAKIVIKHWDF